MPVSNYQLLAKAMCVDALNIFCSQWHRNVEKFIWVNADH